MSTIAVTPQLPVCAVASLDFPPAPSEAFPTVPAIPPDSDSSPQSGLPGTTSLPTALSFHHQQQPPRRHYGMLNSSRAGGYAAASPQHPHSYSAQHSGVDKGSPFAGHRNASLSTVRAAPPHHAPHYQQHHHHHYSSPGNPHHHHGQQQFSVSSGGAQSLPPSRQNSAAVQLQEFMLLQWRNFECRNCDQLSAGECADDRSTTGCAAPRPSQPRKDDLPTTTAAVNHGSPSHSPSEDSPSSSVASPYKKAPSRNQMQLASTSAAAEVPFYRHKTMSVGDGFGSHQPLRHSSSLETVPWQRGYSTPHKTRQNTNNSASARPLPGDSPVRAHFTGRPHHVSVSPGGGGGRVSETGGGVAGPASISRTTQVSSRCQDSANSPHPAGSEDGQSLAAGDTSGNGTAQGAAIPVVDDDPVEAAAVNVLETCANRHCDRDSPSPPAVSSNHTAATDENDSAAADCSIGAHERDPPTVSSSTTTTVASGRSSCDVTCVSRSSPVCVPNPRTGAVAVSVDSDYSSSSCTVGGNLAVGGEQYWTPEGPASPAFPPVENSNAGDERYLPCLAQVQAMTLDGLSDVD